MKCLTWRSEYDIMYLIFDQISNLQTTLTYDGRDDSKVYRKLAKGGQQITQVPIPRTVKNVLVENLRDEIIRGDIVPGQRLRLEEIATRFDVSTMPVREALRDLEAEGLVTIFPHRGAVLPSPN
jgi:hypothetical protein